MQNWLLECAATVGSLISSATFIIAGNESDDKVGKVVDYTLAGLFAAGAAFGYAKTLMEQE